MKTFLLCTLLFSSLVRGQDRYSVALEKTYADVGISTGAKIISQRWKQVSGTVTTNIIRPDSMKTQVRGLIRPGMYVYEISVNYRYSDGYVYTARDSVKVLVKAPTKDQVLVITKTATGRTFTAVSTQNSTGRVTLTNGVATDQNYAVPIFIGNNSINVTRIKPGYVLNFFLNGKWYVL